MKEQLFHGHVDPVRIRIGRQESRERIGEHGKRLHHGKENLGEETQRFYTGDDSSVRIVQKDTLRNYLVEEQNRWYEDDRGDCWPRVAENEISKTIGSVKPDRTLIVVLNIEGHSTAFELAAPRLRRG